MAPSSPDRLRAVRKFEDLIAYLKEELDWPLGEENFDDNLTFEYSPRELGLKDETIAAGTRIRQLRPLKTGQPWGIFFVEFPKKKLPVTVLHRILRSLVIKKRTSSERSKTAAWHREDLLFISAYGDEARGKREIAFGHFHEENGGGPVLRVLAWDDNDTPSKLARLNDTLKRQLAWPGGTESTKAWRERWSSAFRYRPEHVIKTSDHMAEVLAGFARRIRQKLLDGLSAETDKGPHHVLLEAFRTSLLHDLEEAAFADTYAQTVTYGLLSVAISRTQAGQQGTVTADHLVSEVPLTSPFLKEMLSELLKRGGRKGGLDYDDLGLHEVVEFLNSDETDLRAIFADFGNKTESEDPVIYFYEHFLTEYDKKLKIDRGVFYTPKEAVSYIVRSVHELLQSEFGLTDGLADTATWAEVAARNKGFTIPASAKPSDRFVTVLDPATGTATFLVEVIEVIHRTLVARWTREGHGAKARAELWNAYVPEHLLPRLHGYELLMAPYAIAHLKIGLKLAETKYNFGTLAPARVFLTNALEPASEKKLAGLGLMALAHEAEAVNAVKRQQLFTVVIGNPPYSSSITEPTWLMALLGDWKHGLNETKSDLNREEWKFLRFGQHLLEQSGTGVLGFIINRDFLDGITKRRMREHLGVTFPLRTVVDLNGDVKGNISDDNVFKIAQGVAIAVLCTGPSQPRMRFSSRVGTKEAKLSDLLAKTPIDNALVPLEPQAPYFRWLPFGVDSGVAAGAEYSSWRPLNEVFDVYSSGIQTKRDGLCVAFSAEEIWERVTRLNHLPAAAARQEFDLGDDGRDWAVAWAKADIKSSGPSKVHVSEILYRPFDTRFTYWTGRTKGFLAYPRREVMQNVVGHRNVGLIFNRQIVRDPVSHFGASRLPICHGTFYLGNKGQDYYAPLFIFGQDLLGDPLTGRSNLSYAFQSDLRARLGNRGASEVSPTQAFSYLYAVVHSPTYRARYEELLKADFPRVPICNTVGLLHSLAKVGDELLSLHLMEASTLSKPIASFTGPPDPTVGRIGWDGGNVWLDTPAKKKGMAAKSGTVGSRGVPEAVWNFRMGGYQVCEKWLEHREGRTLSAEDITHYQKVIVAISETIRLMNDIDEIIESHGGWPGAFRSSKAKAEETGVIPFPLRIEEPKVDERYVTCLPLVALKAAAGAFGDPQNIDDETFEWVAVDARHRLRRGMFVAKVVGKSMEPAIPDGSFCLFAAPVEGTREGKTVLVQLRDAKDPETGQRYSLKRWESKKVPDGDSWRHEGITLKPINRDFAAIQLAGGEGDLTVIAEFIEVLGQPNATDRG
jgi:hypothetical protein